MKSIRSLKSVNRSPPIPPAISTSGSLLISSSGSCTITNLGTSLTTAWTIETWMYIPSSPTTKYTVFSGIPNSTYSPYALSVSYINSSATYLTLSIGDGTTSATSILNELTGSGSAITTNGWHHFAVTYSSTSGYSMWQDGTKVNSSSITTSISSILSSIVIGSYKSSTSSSSTNFASNCYFSQLRLSNIVRYTSTFPPLQSYGVDPYTVQYFPFSGSNNQSSSLITKSYGSGQISNAILSLTNAYISSAVNVYNPSIPKKYSGLQLWLDSSSYSSLTLSGSYLTTWNDQSGYGRNATLLSGSSYPVFSLSGFNSLLPGIVFTSSGQGFYASCPKGTFTNGVTLYVVFQKSGSVNTYEALVSRTLSGIAAPWDMFNNNRLIGTGSSWVGDYSNLNISTSTGPNVFNALITSNYWQEFRNSIPVASSKPKGIFTDNSSYLYIGTRDNGTSSFTGTISEVLVYNQLLDSRSRLDIESYLMSKWIYSSIYTTIVPSSGPTASTSPTTFSMTGSCYISTAQSKFGSSSLFLPNSNGNYLKMSNFSGSSRLTSKWTIEFFIYMTAYPYNTTVGLCFGANNSANGYIQMCGTSGTDPVRQVAWFLGPSNGLWTISTQLHAGTYSINAWNHIAVTYNGSAYCLCRNGNIDKYLTGNSTNIGPSISQFYFGAFCSNGSFSNNGGGAYFDGLRISSAALYTGSQNSSYTVPSSLTALSNTIYMNSFEGTNNSTVWTNGESYYT